MIDIIFYFGTEIIFVRVEGANIRFANSNQGNQWATIEGLKLDYHGVIKEHPDLKERGDWKEEAIKRFKDKIKYLGDEDLVKEYLIEDLRKYGYTPKFEQKKGFRRVKIE